MWWYKPMNRLMSCMLSLWIAFHKQKVLSSPGCRRSSRRQMCTARGRMNHKTWRVNGRRPPLLPILRANYYTFFRYISLLFPSLWSACTRTTTRTCTCPYHLASFQCNTLSPAAVISLLFAVCAVVFFQKTPGKDPP
ncbi:hypothetical protein BCR43DRAFT_145870 [Syncephalastrum racemosum]|uniref:Uncharacterized protein n=1 Tax=Syncephalastrum racemosum TaxID=13706 RepID=A0A1X2HME0_SYNRA|nr:hypothetical protein BCR43DRAFT_145870 [Syncephalastrum racemosum]